MKGTVLDIEVYPNFVLFAFKTITDDVFNNTYTNLVIQKRLSVIKLESKSACLSKNQRQFLLNIFSHTIITYNGIWYDLPILYYALNGANVAEIYKLSVDIVENGKKKDKEGKKESPFIVLNKYNIKWAFIDYHIDLMQVLAGGAKKRLKAYGARMHIGALENLPYAFDTDLTDEQMEVVTKYCEKDLIVTEELFKRVTNEVALRYDLWKKEGINFLYRSNAQIAEKLFKKILGIKEAPKYNKRSYEVKLPYYIDFKLDSLKELKDNIEKKKYILNKKGRFGKDRKKEEIEYDEYGDEIIIDKKYNFSITIYNSDYTVGIGGLHSKEKKRGIKCNEEQTLIDKDVVSYYPAIILNNNTTPKHLGSTFQTLYRKLVEQRLEAKRNGNKQVSASLKIVVNGTFGKFSDPYSVLYDPQCHLDVTLTGQLSLLCLIETLELSGIKVVSANTDGVTALVNKEQEDNFQEICKEWERYTGFNLEEQRYIALYSLSVNNYLAIKDNGDCKTKGKFSEEELTKDRDYTICYEAVKEFLVNNIPIKNTIYNCTDIKGFIVMGECNKGGEAMFVKGDEVDTGVILGKVYRFVYSCNEEERGNIVRSENGNQLSRATEVVPMMDLIDYQYIDYPKYLKIAEGILKDIT
ncbi:hypothetical protein AB832_07600 [Flavobacteriaceae bacterium (ex Bugula neritina AB1)]|nr:hypothetical protein AB832_07600 [Flavobacteriaceae bacterium (ex Bugula neritina AB1)]